MGDQSLRPVLIVAESTKLCDLSQNSRYFTTIHWYHSLLSELSQDMRDRSHITEIHSAAVSNSGVVAARHAELDEWAQAPTNGATGAGSRRDWPLSLTTATGSFVL